jgi:hypothetical protein
VHVCTHAARCLCQPCSSPLVPHPSLPSFRSKDAQCEPGYSFLPGRVFNFNHRFEPVEQPNSADCAASCDGDVCRLYQWSPENKLCYTFQLQPHLPDQRFQDYVLCSSNGEATAELCCLLVHLTHTSFFCAYDYINCTSSEVNDPPPPNPCPYPPPPHHASFFIFAAPAPVQGFVSLGVPFTPEVLFGDSYHPICAVDFVDDDEGATLLC